jgi:hypothetical protein
MSSVCTRYGQKMANPYRMTELYLNVKIGWAPSSRSVPENLAYFRF